MNRNIPTILAALLCMALLTGCATTAVTTGDKNFERAWNAFNFNQMDKADAYFKAAADNYRETTNDDPPARTTRFRSTRLKAGISFYFAGEYEACVKAMKLAVTRKESVWEANLFSGLSYARMDDKDNTIKSLTLFIDDMSSQRVLTNVVIPQLKGIEDGTIQLQAAADAIDKAFHDQISQNINLSRTPQNTSIPGEHCSRRYWWRYNKKPCMSMHDYID